MPKPGTMIKPGSPDRGFTVSAACGIITAMVQMRDDEMQRGFRIPVVYKSLGLLLGLMVLAALPSGMAQAKGVAPVYTGYINTVAVGGYDPVAYFKEGKPVQGIKTHSLMHQGAEWRFSSAENRAAFLANPAQYAPQFGGYCAWAVSRGYTASGDPEAWHIENGRLYLNYSKEIRETWRADIPGNISRGEGNWPRLLQGE